MKKLIIFGNNIIAVMLYHDILKNKPEWNVEAFTADESYLSGADVFCSLPLVGFKRALELYPPSEYDMISTVDAPTCMRNRMKVFNRIKAAGYSMPNYISPLSDTSDFVEMGENNLIMAFAHVGYGGVMGNANFIRQNVYLGHDFRMGDGITIAAGCSIAGCCEIGGSSFIGVGAVIADHLRIAEETLIGAGSVVVKDTHRCTKYVGNPARPIGTHEDTGVAMNIRA